MTRDFLRGLLILCLMGVVSTGWAQAPAPVPPNPQAPTINMTGPMGMQRGTTMELTLTGANLAAPTGFWTSIPGAKATIPTDANNGKDAGKLRVRLEVPKDAPLGFHTIRLATHRGLSNLRIFCVDDLAQITEVDTNRSKATPQTVPIPCVVVGRSDAEANDYFRISVKSGQRLTFEVLGRRLGSALDPQITLYDARTGRELPGGHSNDAPGLQTDARLTYVFKESGDVLLEIRDVMYRGGGDFWYRLRIGDFPCAVTPLPLAVKRGGKANIQFAGPLVDSVAAVEVTAPADPTAEAIWVAPRGANGLMGWAVPMALSNFDELVEQEPNNEPAKANRIPVPGGVSGRIQERGDIDHFAFAAKKGQRYLIEAQTHELGSPAEIFLALKDAKGNQVAAMNPAADPRIDYTAGADGDLVVVVDHLLNQGGPEEAYRVTVTPYEPSFELNLGIDRYDIPQGTGAALSVFAVRKDFAGPIELSVVGPAGLSGQAVIPAGQPAAPNVPAAVLLLSGKAEMPLGPYTLAVQAKGVFNNQPFTRYVSVRNVVSQNMAALTFPPRQLNHQIGIAVTDKPPFTLAAKFDQPEAVRGLATTVTVTATRAPGFAEDIVLAPLGLPPTVAPALKNIPKGKNEVKVTLTPAAAVPLGKIPFALSGKGKYQNVDYTVPTPPLNLTVALPFELQVSPAPLKIAQGAKAKLKVTAVRKGGYQGPIGLEVRNLPANVTAPKATIAMGQTSVEIEITVAAAAAVGDKAGVNVLGTATAAANQQNASPNFVLGVLKK